MSTELSVILVVGDRRDRAIACLASLLAQDVIASMEIQLFDCAPHLPPIVGSDHPAVRTIPLAADTLFSTAKARGIREAKAPVVVFFEEHARAHAGWARALLAAHHETEPSWAGVGAEVHNGNGRVRVSRHLELANYHPWLPPAERAEHGMLPGHNSSWKREVLLRYDADLEDLLRAEIVLHQMLVRDGHRLLAEPAARFEHLNETTLESSSRGRFLWNRLYAPARARFFGWSWARRIFYVLVMPLIPIYSLVRLSLFFSLKRRDYLGRFVQAIPLLAIVQAASAAGFALGLLRGEGDAEAKFTWFEMNEPRDPNPALHPEPASES